MHDTPENLAYWATRGLGRMFIAVYLGYYHFGQLLYYQFLHHTSSTNTTPSSPSSNNNPSYPLLPPSTHETFTHYASLCKSHATSLCTLVYASHTPSALHPACDVQYTMVGHILVIASTIQIHTLLFSASAPAIAAAKERLERNFQILSQLRVYWPTLDVSFTRLRAFHKACRDSMDESFRLDLWMLRFLSEFAVPVDDKVVGVGGGLGGGLGTGGGGLGLQMGSPDMGVWSWENIEGNWTNSGADGNLM